MDDFSENDRDVIHRVIKARRDIREFRSDPVPAEVLNRIIEAGHHAPSVGFMQPWNFIIVRSKEIRQQIKDSFIKMSAAEAEKIQDESRRKLYKSLKLEGVVESPLNIAVTCDRNRGGEFVLGRGPMPETDLYSTCLAVQNMWLAARAEGVGMGWVSIIDPKIVSQLLSIPENITLVAYLTVGYPTKFNETPLLETVGWRKRTPLENLVFEESWGTPAS